MIFLRFIWFCLNLQDLFLHWCENVIHTGAGDAFAFLKHTGRKNFFTGKRAKLESPSLTGPICMKFYFYIYGKDNGYLRISTKLHTSSEEKEKTKIVGSYGRKWILGQTFLPFAPTETYQVRIDVTIKKSFFSWSKNKAIVHLTRIYAY